MAVIVKHADTGELPFGDGLLLAAFDSREEQPEIVMRRNQVGILLQRVAIEFFGFGCLAFRRLQRAESVERLGRIRRELRSLPVGGFGFAAAIQKSHPDLDMSDILDLMSKSNFDGSGETTRSSRVAASMARGMT